MPFKFYQLIMTAFLFTNPLLGTITTCQVLKNKKTGQTILIYGDDQARHTVEEQQNSLIAKNIGDILDKNDPKLAILYEEPENCFKDYIKEVGINNPLLKLNDYFNALKDLKNGLTNIIAIRVRNSANEKFRFFLKLFNDRDKAIDMINLRSGVVYDKSLICGEDKSPVCDKLYELFYHDVMKDFNRLKTSIKSSKYKFDLLMQEFLEQEIKRIESGIKPLEDVVTYAPYINILKWFKLHYVKYFLEDNPLRRSNYNYVNPYFAPLYSMDDASMRIQNLNTLLYILDHNEIDKYIIFLREGNDMRLVSLLLNHFSFEQLHSQSNPIIMGSDWQDLGVEHEDFSSFDQNFDLINSINNINTYEVENCKAQKEFSKLIAQVKQEIKEPPYGADKWYAYSLEDMLEDMESIPQKPEDITADTVMRYKKNWSSMKKDFGVGFWDQLHNFLGDKQEQQSCPAVIQQPYIVEQQPLYLNTSNNLNFLYAGNGTLAITRS